MAGVAVLALIALVLAMLPVRNAGHPDEPAPTDRNYVVPPQGLPKFCGEPSYVAGVAVLALIALVLAMLPVRNAGHPDEPAPPTAIM